MKNITELEENFSLGVRNFLEENKNHWHVSLRILPHVKDLKFSRKIFQFDIDCATYEFYSGYYLYDDMFYNNTPTLYIYEEKLSKKNPEQYYLISGVGEVNKERIIKAFVNWLIELI